uniref:Uncharacterized protein n=1 Tax=Glycine max TaxID=3847 RepID=A0A0R0ILM6_SOYBN
MMLGVELVSDRELKTPAQNETLHVMDQMKELGVLIGKGGYYGNVFRITPKKMQTSLWMRWTTHFPSEPNTPVEHQCRDSSKPNF